MFLANSLRDKLKRNYLENDADTFGKARYPYQPAPKDPRLLLSFKGGATGILSPSQEYTTQQLQALDKKEWESKFTVGKLKKEWNTKVDIDFEPKHKKFSDDMMSPEVIESKRYVKELIDPDILELKQKKWNISSDVTTQLRPELKKTLFEVSHGLKDFKVVPLKEPKFEEGCSSRDLRIVDGKKWDISTKLEKIEKKELGDEILEKAIENSNYYWKSNEMNRLNGEPFPISEDRKKVEVIRYFKKYRTPYQQINDYEKTMKKVKELTALEKIDVEKMVKYKNPGTRYQEKIDALVFKEMYNRYKYKYNELTGNLSKEEIKKKQREENKFHWKDEDLINKIVAVNDLKDTNWFKPEYTNERLCRSQDKLKRELLKPLVIKGTEIHDEEDRLKEKAEDEYKKQQKRELMLKLKRFPRRYNNTSFTSKYPITKEEYETIKESELEDDNSNVMKAKRAMFNSLGLERVDPGPFFLEAYHKIAGEECEKLNKIYRKNKDNIEYEYSHPGTYREFDLDNKKDKLDILQKEIKKENQIEKYENSDKADEKTQEKSYEKSNDRSIEKSNDKSENPLEEIKETQSSKKFWSCCMNSDKNSKGCQRKVIKKFRWLYDGP